MTSKPALLSILLTAVLCPCLAATLPAQTPAPAQKAIGSIKSISGKTVTLKTDSGIEVKVLVQDSTKILRAVPGASLKDATPISIQDLRPGDRVLVHGTAGENQAIAARLMVAMTRSDIVQKQQQELQQWRNGVGGLVKTVDPSAETATISTTSPTGPKDVVVKISKTTIIRRYAPNSVKFDDAKPGTLDQILPGDQLRARGTKNADGTELAADEVVSGTFHNIAGLITSVDSANSTITVNDLATKKPVTIHITADSQMHKLPPFVAQRLAMQIKGVPQNAAGPQNERADARPAMEHRLEGRPGSPGEGRPAGGDLSQMLSRMPVATIADLANGEAVMVVTTSDATAITLLSGVEPILTASPNGSGAASLLTPWSLGSGGAEAGGDVPQ
ncbi:MAG: DUF5666 domain-containing protein [Terriglobia bacterium]|jgi:hypothetical protein|nr:DUF5666 domain-containing protein [Terriglobia bacterium]